MTSSPQPEQKDIKKKKLRRIKKSQASKKMETVLPNITATNSELRTGTHNNPKPGEHVSKNKVNLS